MSDLARFEFADSEQMFATKGHELSDKLQFVEFPLINPCCQPRQTKVCRTKKAAIAGRCLLQVVSVAGRSTITTPSSSSNSCSITLMISLFFVGTSLPM